MNIISKKIIVALLVLQLASIGFAQDFMPANEELLTPHLPASCGVIEAPEGTRLSLRSYALGVQIYRWNGASWDFVAPLANLYADEKYYQQIGFHGAGPIWENNRGSVVAARVDGCTPDPTAIPWLLLRASSNDGHGVFRKVTFIQRVNTAGGLPPANPGTTIGEVKRVPYTAEYYFYRGGTK